MNSKDHQEVSFQTDPIFFSDRMLHFLVARTFVQSNAKSLKSSHKYRKFRWLRYASRLAKEIFILIFGMWCI